MADNIHMIDRYMGTLVGGAIGDALGWPIEFRQLEKIQESYGLYGIQEPGWQITDDTQMTLFGAEGLLRAAKGSKKYLSETHASYIHWYTTQGYSGASADWMAGPDDDFYDRLGDAHGSWNVKPHKAWRRPVTPDFRDAIKRNYPSELLKIKALHASRAPGNTTMSSLGAVKQLLQPVHNDSPGNGPIMRIAPVGMLFRNDPYRAYDEGVANAALTHGRMHAQFAAGAQAMLIALLLQGTEKYAAVHMVEKHLAAEQSATSNIALQLQYTAVINALAMARRAKRRKTHMPVKLPTKFWGIDTLTAAVYALLKTDSFVHGLRISVNNSGDSDTIGAVAGNLLGAYYGRQAIPNYWIAKVELTQEAAVLAVGLFEAAKETVNGNAEHV